MNRRSLHFLRGATALLGSGVVSTVGFMLVASNRWRLIDPAVGASLILFVQWQMLGLTVAKLGIDQIVFAAVSESRSRVVNTKQHFTRRTLPLALVFSLVVAVVFTPWTAVVCFASLLFDTNAAIMIADLNGREQFLRAAIANLLNYPLFFLAVFLLHAFLGITTTGVLGVFMATSAARWLWLLVQRRRLAYLPQIPCHSELAMGYQQLLNYLAFRSDQVLLGTGIAARITRDATPDFLRKYLFLARYPEVVSGVIVTLGGLLLPRLFVRYPPLRDLGGIASKAWLLIGLYVVTVAGPIYAYAMIWSGSPIHPILAADFGLSALLVLPANVITYSMIRQGYLTGLIRNLAISVGLGLLLNAAGYALSSPIPLVVTVPSQLLLFVVLGLTRGWSVRKPLYG